MKSASGSPAGNGQTIYRLYPVADPAVTTTYENDRNVCGDCVSGACCSSEGPIAVSAFDILRLATHLDLTPENFLKLFTQDVFDGCPFDPAAAIDDPANSTVTYLRRRGPEAFSPCIFLKYVAAPGAVPRRVCSVHEARPLACREYLLRYVQDTLDRRTRAQHGGRLPRARGRARLGGHCPRAPARAAPHDARSKLAEPSMAASDLDRGGSCRGTRPGQQRRYGPSIAGVDAASCRGEARTHAQQTAPALRGGIWFRSARRAVAALSVGAARRRRTRTAGANREASCSSPNTRWRGLSLHRRPAVPVSPTDEWSGGEDYRFGRRVGPG